VIIIGIDPSLSGTGLAVIDTEDALVAYTHTITSKPCAATIEARVQRQARICRELLNTLPNGELLAPAVDLAVIEAPAYDSRTGSQHDRSGLWWRIIDRLLEHHVPVVEVTTGGVKKYATGKGTSPKDTVLLAVARRFPNVDVQNNNEADALILAAMGARHLGHPIDDMPKAHTAALDAVTWPGPQEAA
jgi:crossover junction endodeoxyribonuclease RuvC